MDNRTFTTPDDMMKVFRWLVDNGKWEKFGGYNNRDCYARLRWRKEVYPYIDETSDNEYKCYLTWLFYNPERFCCLVAQAKKEGVLE
jgi:hypothetical protein